MTTEIKIILKSPWVKVFFIAGAIAADAGGLLALVGINPLEQFGNEGHYMTKDEYAKLTQLINKQSMEIDSLKKQVEFCSQLQLASERGSNLRYGL